MTVARIVRIEAQGGPEVMQLVDVELPPPGPGEVQLRQTAIGFNFVDIYQRSGLYKVPLPSGVGNEAAGVVEALGADVADIAVGDRVAYATAGAGAYASARNVAAAKLVKIPAGVSDEQAAVFMLKGMTAQFLVKKTHRIEPGDLVIVHAAAGGVGQILVRWAKALGAIVVGTAGGPEKVARVLEIGADHAIDYRRPDWVEAVLAATGGTKARVVYDSVGKDTFLKSLDLTAPFGLVALYGAASGPVEPLDLQLLAAKGCLFVTRPSLFQHAATTAALREGAADLFEAIAAGIIGVDIGARFRLDDIVAAHRAAEARATTGAILITP
ncbi:MAG: quinone oxidoreductase [Ancalomicrobiaceae bacterium]|nr:quinone oxidoreductase [Ancalomicrobiaceae bacterium]